MQCGLRFGNCINHVHRSPLILRAQASSKYIKGSFRSTSSAYMGAISNHRSIGTVAPASGDCREDDDVAKNNRAKRFRHLYKGLSETERTFIDTLVRVDHAGELGADRIYAGQYAVLKTTPVGPTVKEMWEQEKHHLATFERLMNEYRVRPSALYPVWNVAGWVLGAGSAALGKEAAMACTVAVETVIGEHYDSQLRELLSMDEAKEGDRERRAELCGIISQFRDEELHHLETGLENDAEMTPFYNAYKTVIETGCRAAIKVAERV
ncbi:hypothetical protein SARC_04267 [Sphaeroforma arctica JP610]|uniref:5-demethoxyubiquinone hydroxylase, mitochondrial n=1 Tax=Sphaeroforma arctica JP610 TaxID=667725 RepID=A0A0L0G3S3_9EUKA|nr:hypothetical protein SARC_04267 [Sphaeroforma arctica JP610]KNC83486.1 hypothetical protein SARC_04267 [Sphaeroforma arctica JP610]|eukprot:XP_014157388.1 hypothetical protein SARC_04267 [Sphaeroforma arctica JP610]